MKRYGKAKTRELKALAKMTAHDRAEVLRFKEFLGDSKGGKLTLKELLIKHGEYMGYTPAEINELLIAEGYNDVHGV